MYKRLSPKNQGKIDTVNKEKDYKIRFDNTEVKFLHWQDLISVIVIKPGLMDTIYTYFSLYSHPSNVAIFQFGELFKDAKNEFLRMSNFNTKNVFILFSVFVADYIKLFPETIRTFESLDLIYQILLNGHNTITRGQCF